MQKLNAKTLQFNIELYFLNQIYSELATQKTLSISFQFNFLIWLVVWLLI